MWVFRAEMGRDEAFALLGRVGHGKVEEDAVTDGFLVK